MIAAGWGVPLLKICVHLGIYTLTTSLRRAGTCEEAKFGHLRPDRNVETGKNGSFSPHYEHNGKYFIYRAQYAVHGHARDLASGTFRRKANFKYAHPKSRNVLLLFLLRLLRHMFTSRTIGSFVGERSYKGGGGGREGKEAKWR